MYGLAVYLDYELKTRVKNEASRMLKDITGYLEGISYDFSLQFAVPSTFDGKKCVLVTDPGPPPKDVNLCEFEYSDPINFVILDNDSDGIPDFFDPYNGDNKTFLANPRTVAPWLSIYPSTTGNACTVSVAGTGTGTVNFDCVRRVAGKDLYAGVTVSRIVDDYGRELGRAFGVIVWYFEPRTDKYISMKSIVFKEYEDRQS